jgi:hypothetical protein
MSLAGLRMLRDSKPLCLDKTITENYQKRTAQRNELVRGRGRRFAAFEVLRESLMPLCLAARHTSDRKTATLLSHATSVRMSTGDDLDDDEDEDLPAEEHTLEPDDEFDEEDFDDDFDEDFEEDLEEIDLPDGDDIPEKEDDALDNEDDDE